jgi:hypothetical protein
MGVWVPIVFWLVIGAIVLVPAYLKHLDRQQMHETLRRAYENGQPVPPELITALQSSPPSSSMNTPDSDLRRGIVLIATGIGLAGLGYALWYGLMTVSDTAAYIAGGCTAASGAIPGLIGAGYVALWVSRRRRTDLQG